MLYRNKVIFDFKKQDENDPSTSVEFTSPYVVKVTKEKESRRLEEVDLITGRRRSWIETCEHDVIDLTGGTPAKTRTPLSSLRVNTRTNGWLEGKCWGKDGWGGEGCQYRHYYTEDDAPTPTLRLPQVK